MTRKSQQTQKAAIRALPSKANNSALKLVAFIFSLLWLADWVTTGLKEEKKMNFVEVFNAIQAWFVSQGANSDEEKIECLCDKFTELVQYVQNSNPNTDALQIAFISLAPNAQVAQSEWGNYFSHVSSLNQDEFKLSTEGIRRELEMAAAFGAWGWGKATFSMPESWLLARSLIVNKIIVNLFKLTLYRIHKHLFFEVKKLNDDLKSFSNDNSTTRLMLIRFGLDWLNKEDFINNHLRFHGNREFTKKGNNNNEGEYIKEEKNFDKRWNPNIGNLEAYLHGLLIGQKTPRILDPNFLEWLDIEYGIRLGNLLVKGKFDEEIDEQEYFLAKERYLISRVTHTPRMLFHCTGTNIEMRCGIYYPAAKQCPRCKAKAPQGGSTLWEPRILTTFGHDERKGEDGVPNGGLVVNPDLSLSPELLQRILKIFNCLVEKNIITEEQSKSLFDDLSKIGLTLTLDNFFQSVLVMEDAKKCFPGRNMKKK